MEALQKLIAPDDSVEKLLLQLLASHVPSEAIDEVADRDEDEIVRSAEHHEDPVGALLEGHPQRLAEDHHPARFIRSESALIASIRKI